MREGRMRIYRGVAAGRQPVDHRRPPGVQAEKPVKIRLLQRAKSLVPGKLPVPVTLDCKTDGQIIAAPDKGHTPVKGIVFGPLPDVLNPLTVVFQYLLFSITLQLPGQFIMPEINKRIVLIVIGSIAVHPGRDRFFLRITDGRIQQCRALFTVLL